jgi:hypothetical protein
MPPKVGLGHAEDCHLVTHPVITDIPDGSYRRASRVRVWMRPFRVAMIGSHAFR